MEMPLSRSSLRPNASKHSLVAPLDNRLSIIDEDAVIQHALPSHPAAFHRPFSKRWGDPPRPGFDKSPPDYSATDAAHLRSEKMDILRNNKHVIKRGGWKRLCLTLLVLVVVIIGVVVGLTLGLRQRGWRESSTPSATDVSPVASEPFPAGFYSISTFLDSVNTSCTSNPVTWTCYPYVTYAQSQSAASATFNWVIAQSGSGYMISTTSDPFAISFMNVSLTLVDSGSSNERYTFALPSAKYVIPSSIITNDGTMAGCYFNNTHIEGSLYTKKLNTYPSNLTTTTSTPPATTTAATNGLITSETFQSWPYAIEFVQSAAGGFNVPDCYHVVNGNIGAGVNYGFTTQSSRHICDCSYRNYA